MLSKSAEYALRAITGIAQKRREPATPDAHLRSEQTTLDGPVRATDAAKSLGIRFHERMTKFCSPKSLERHYDPELAAGMHGLDS